MKLEIYHQSSLIPFYQQNKRCRVYSAQIMEKGTTRNNLNITKYLFIYDFFLNLFSVWQTMKSTSLHMLSPLTN